jgi:hypothetical protein
MPSIGQASAQGTSKINVRSAYTLNRYGFATINETVMITNNGTSAIQVPSVTIGFGNLTSDVVAANVTQGFSVGTPPSTGGPFTVTSSESIQAGANVTFNLNALVNNVVSTEKNGSLQVLVLASPSFSAEVNKILDFVQMPASTTFNVAPTGLTASTSSSNDTYSATFTNVTPAASTYVGTVSQSTSEDFNPLRIFSASRTITASGNGTPLVTDTIEFENMGTVTLAQIYVSPLTSSSAEVTIVTATATEPVLLAPFTLDLSGNALDLAEFVAGYPNDGVGAGSNFTLTYQYPLSSSYYTVSGGQVTVKIPDSPPVGGFIGTYNITLSLPHTTKVVQGTPTKLAGVTPWQTGTTTLAYSLSEGWFLDGGIPFASVVFVLLLIGLFVARTTTVEAEGEKEEEETTSSEAASSMINAFDEKTSMTNGVWQEIESKDPNELDKAYFDELRSRMDIIRSKALQRLNDVRQKSTNQKFADVINQMQATEREVDRAAKDKLNLYQQYYLKQMRKEVFDRLLPQYTKRLERALNQLSDELHTVQREAKLL